MSEGENSNLNSSGLLIANNETIRSFLLKSIIQDSNLNQQHHQIALNLSSQNNVPYKLIRNLWTVSSPSRRPKLIHLFNDSEFVLTSPKPREKSAELKERLRKLSELAERREYNELVKDITPRKPTSDPFSSYTDQLRFGMHVIVTMFTGYLIGYAAFRALFNHSAAMNAAGGILGLILSMLVETLLFIIKASSEDLTSSSSTSVLKKQQ
ncbi:hypothetical protein IFM89_031473 [Coptis chinensis]|uniref:Uncharacterized protein n=1 Tax=Coptis chinensis TaxID=261450 RepID=A0A835HE51_9MAGN|nr:hypothetical protein IFM89_031473 [Coptis chinensis]